MMNPWFGGNPKFPVGVCYYPEYWPEERWPLDARLMREAGLSVARLGEFAWYRMEPEEGRFDLDWLARAIDILAGEGLRVVLGTPTAGAPSWLVHTYPDVLRQRRHIPAFQFGGSHSYCVNNPSFLRSTERIVQAMAGRLGEHPAVIGWQIDNELGCYGMDCDCPYCEAGFREWLRARYGTVTALDDAWGTRWRGQTYNRWDHVELPNPAQPLANPAALLDAHRYFSDSYGRFLSLQADILRQTSPGRFVTHNCFRLSEYGPKWFEAIDLMAYDLYPGWSRDHGPAYFATCLDLVRGCMRQNFWMMETECGGGDIVGNFPSRPAPLPGEIRLWAYRAVGHGADAILYFRWRTSLSGASGRTGLLGQGARPSPQLAEVARVASEFGNLGPVLAGTMPHAQVAILWDLDVEQAFAIQSHLPGFRYQEHVEQFERALMRRGITVDIILSTAELKGYRLVVVPALWLMSEAVATSLASFVQGGGILVVTSRTGAKTVHNTLLPNTPPGPLADLLGCCVRDWTVPLASKDSRIQATADWLGGQAFPSTMCQEWLDVSTAEGIARYADGPYVGQPAVTYRQVGAGHTFYLGTFSDDAFMQMLLDVALELAEQPTDLDLPDQVELCSRGSDDHEILFMLNHGDEAVDVAVPPRLTWVLPEKSLSDRLCLEPFGVHVAERKLIRNAEPSR